MQNQLDKYYQLLGVTELTPLSQIRLARKRLLRLIHPDRFSIQDPQRREAEEQAKQVNEAFESIRKARALPKPQPQISAVAEQTEAVKQDTPRSSRRRLETVESKVVIRNGKVVMVKRKRPVKYGKFLDLRDSARALVQSTAEILDRKLAEKKSKSAPAMNNLNIKERVSQVVHIVEGKVSVEGV